MSTESTLLQFYPRGELHIQKRRTLGEVFKGERRSICDLEASDPIVIKHDQPTVNATCKRCLKRAGIIPRGRNKINLDTTVRMEQE